MFFILFNITWRKETLSERGIGNIGDVIQKTLWGLFSFLSLFVLLSVIGKLNRVTIFVGEGNDGERSFSKEGLGLQEIGVGFAQIFDKSD